jgi:hypothetical protein
MKVHSKWQAANLDYELCFTCHRDLRDVALSLKDYRGLTTDEEILTGVGGARQCHDEFSPIAAADIAYHRMMSEPAEVLAELAQVLGVARAGIDGTHVMSLRIGSRDTNIASTAVPDEWKTQLSPALQAAIEDAHGDWLRRLGYLARGARRSVAVKPASP